MLLLYDTTNIIIILYYYQHLCTSSERSGSFLNDDLIQKKYIYINTKKCRPYLGIDYLPLVALQTLNVAQFPILLCVTSLLKCTVLHRQCICQW